MFKVGDKVLYKKDPTHYTGIVVAVMGSSIRIKFRTTEYHPRLKNYDCGICIYSEDMLILDTSCDTEQTTQEKVLAKIKKLEAAYAQRMKEKQNASKSVSVQTGQRLSQTIGPAAWHLATERTL